MKELKSIAKVPEPEPSTQYTYKARRLTKRWKAAKRRPRGHINQDDNQLVEHFYHQVLTSVKKHFNTSPKIYSQPIFEKDYKEDNTENSFTMHTFISSTFYWYLECDFSYRYQVEYDFHDCPFETEIREIMERCFWARPTTIKHTMQQPNCHEFYKRVLMVQDEEFIRLL